MDRLTTALKLIGFPSLVFVAGLILLNLLTRPIDAANEKPLYVRSGYSEQDAETYWTALDQRGLLSTESLALIVDLLFPLCYGYAFRKSILAAWRELGQPRFWNFAVVPVWLAVLADWIENLLLLYLLQIFVKSTPASIPERFAPLVQIASAATFGKFFFLIVSGLALLIFVVKFLCSKPRA